LSRSTPNEAFHRKNNIGSPEEILDRLLQQYQDYLPTFSEGKHFDLSLDPKSLLRTQIFNRPGVPM